MIEGKQGLRNVQFFRRNFYHASFEEASMVVCYLFPGAMKKLRPKFEEELRPGTWVITDRFHSIVDSDKND